MLLDFLTEKAPMDILAERNSNPYPSTKRCVLVRFIVQYVFENYGQYPSQDLKINVAHAVVAIFPGLKCHADNKLPIVSILFFSRKNYNNRSK